MNSFQICVGNVGPETVIPCTSSMGISPVGVADPHRGRERGRVPAEPRVRVVLGRARLAGGRPPEVSADTRPAGDVLAQDPRHLGGDPVRDHARPLRLAPAARRSRRSAGRRAGSPSAWSRSRPRRASRTRRPSRAARPRSSRARWTAPAEAACARRACAPCSRRSALRPEASAARRPCCRSAASPSSTVMSPAVAVVVGGDVPGRRGRVRLVVEGAGDERRFEPGSIPCDTAVVSTKVLNVEPACRRACAARLNSFFVRPGMTPVIALIAPVAGSIATSAEAGSVR